MKLKQTCHGKWQVCFCIYEYFCGKIYNLFITFDAKSVDLSAFVWYHMNESKIYILLGIKSVHPQTTHLKFKRIYKAQERRHTTLLRESSPLVLFCWNNPLGLFHDSAVWGSSFPQTCALSSCCFFVEIFRKGYFSTAPLSSLALRK